MLSDIDILIAGQLKTSRTETLEDYLRSRSRSLAVIGLTSPFAVADVSRCTQYACGKKVKERELFHMSIRRWGYWGIGLTVLAYSASVCVSLLFLRKKFHLFIGIATFSGLIGVLLKKCGLVAKAVYYCLDYYPAPARPGVIAFLNVIFKHMDRFIVRNADAVWDLSPRISGGREKYAGVAAGSYKELVVPLGYSDGVSADVPYSERERWTLGFVGTLSPNQGLALAAEAMPELAGKFPEIRLRVIGDGPFADNLKRTVQRLGVARHFVFHGFIESDEEVYRILSRCMAGLALWTGAGDDNSLFADPGKPKLYALLGLPVIITRETSSARVVTESGAGVAIAYEKDAFIKAVEEIISDEAHFERYHSQLKNCTALCRSTAIFDWAFDEMGPLLFSYYGLRYP